MESPRPPLEHTPVGDAAFPQSITEIANARKRSLLNGPERRTRVRLISSLPLTVKYDGIYEAVAEAANISARGMFFVLQQRLELGSVVALIFRLPRRVIGIDNIWLRCPAQVVRLQEGLPEGKFGIGARITSYEVFRVS